MEYFKKYKSLLLSVVIFAAVYFAIYQYTKENLSAESQQFRELLRLRSGFAGGRCRIYFSLVDYLEQRDAFLSAEACVSFRQGEVYPEPVFDL